MARKYVSISLPRFFQGHSKKLYTYEKYNVGLMEDIVPLAGRIRNYRLVDEHPGMVRGPGQVHIPYLGDRMLVPGVLPNEGLIMDFGNDGFDTRPIYRRVDDDYDYDGDEEVLDDDDWDLFCRSYYW